MRFQGEKLRELRLGRKWDQHRLAEEARHHGAGVNQASVSRHEGGMQPSGTNALAYARALGVEVSCLYADEDGSDDEEAALPSLDMMLRDYVRRLVREEAVRS